jgi:hypothetical protein
VFKEKNCASAEQRKRMKSNGCASGFFHELLCVLKIPRNDICVTLVTMLILKINMWNARFWVIWAINEEKYRSCVFCLLLVV